MARWTHGRLPPCRSCLAINWFGDSLDGTVARVRHQQRPRYGYYVDHVVDRRQRRPLFGGLAASGLMQPVLALVLLVAYVLLCAESFLATHAVGVFRLSFSGVRPTELRILLAVGALVAIGRPTVTPFGWGPFALFDMGGRDRRDWDDRSVSDLRLPQWSPALSRRAADPERAMSRVARFAAVGRARLARATRRAGYPVAPGAALRACHGRRCRAHDPAQLRLARALHLARSACSVGPGDRETPAALQRVDRRRVDLGNVLVTALTVQFLELPVLVATTLAGVTLSLVNYASASRWVFDPGLAGQLPR